MSEIKRGDIVAVGPDGILRTYIAGDFAIGVAAYDSAGDEPVQLLKCGDTLSEPAPEYLVTLDRDQSVMWDEDEDD